MRLNKIEKIIVAVLVIGGILAAGIFMFIMPAIDKIGAAEKKYDKLVTEKSNLEAELSREATIDQEISDSQKEAKKLEGGFYPDLTTYEASEITLAYLAANNLETHSIDTSYLSVKDLKLEAYKPTEIIYNLKTYSQIAKGIDENALLEGQFKDGSKVYNIVITDIADIIITDEDNNVIEKNKYTDNMKKAYNQALCEYAMTNNNAQAVGFLNVDFEISGKYKDYLAFLDYVNGLDRATMLIDTVIPMTVKIEEDKDSETVYVDEAGQMLTGSKANGGETVCDDNTDISEVKVSLRFLCVEPMNEMETLQAGDQTIVVNQ